MPPDSPTLLLVAPQDDPLGLLADSVGGGRVPVWGRYPGTSFWETLATHLEVHTLPVRALVLSLRGTWDDIGMARFRHALRRYGCHEHYRVQDDWTLAQIRDALAALLREIGGAPTYRLALVNAEGREVS
jgi:hypothetical protein